MAPHALPESDCAARGVDVSGYFARLSAQLQAPAGPARRAAAPAPLEQHVETISPATVQAPGEAHAQEARPAAPARAHPQPEQAVPSNSSVQAATQTLHAAPSLAPLAAQVREAAMAARVPRDAADIAPPADAHAPMFAPLARTSPIGVQSRPQPLDSTARIDTVAETFAPRATSPASSATQSNVPRSSSADARPWQAEPLFQDLTQPPQDTHEVRPAAFVRPTAPAPSGDRAQTAKAMPASTPSTPAERSTVRIGTITLEVHPPAVTAPAAPQPVAAAPNPAPSQFSLRRHHLRWS